MKVNITTSIDPIMHQKARDHNISWSDALEFGINFLIAEKEGVDYPPSRLMTKIANLQRVIAEKCEEIETLKSQSGFVTADKLPDVEKEMEDVFDGKPITN